MPLGALRPADAISVEHASLRGISQEIADQIWARPLVGVPLPIRIRLLSGERSAFITRDEAGRFRISGQMPGEDGAAARSEAQQIRSAAEVCDLVLSASLEAWGVRSITTNDSTGRSS